jgi:uncharacterized protein with FMN-binding domain
MRKLMSAAAVSLAVALALVGCGSSSSTAASTASSAAEETSSGSAEYTATAESEIGGEVSVTITVVDGKIESAVVDVSSQTAGFGADHQADFEEMIVAANGAAELDGVSGCTLTSNAIQAAYEDVLAQAGLN